MHRTHLDPVMEILRVPLRAIKRVDEGWYWRVLQAAPCEWKWITHQWVRVEA